MFFWNGIPPSIASEILSSNKNLTSRPWQLTSPRFVTGRMDQAPLNDLRVRQAISYAIDRAQWIDLVREGKGRPSGSMPYMLTKPWYLEPKELGDNAKYLDFNLAEAKKLMQAAGLTDGFEMEIKPYTALTAKLPEMDLLTAQLAKINIKLKPVYLPGSQFLQQVSRDKNYTGMLFWTHGFTSDFDPLMYNTFVTTNVMMIKDDTLKGFMDKQRITLDPKERAGVIADYQKYQAEQCYALYEPIADQQMLYPKSVVNWGPHNSFDVGGMASVVWRSA
jgi:peptide/nickel transport system substrate-binding protein